MKKDLTELVFILDKSGSMHGLEKDTIGGFNSVIEKQKKESGEVIVSTILFNDSSHVIYDRTNISNISLMTSNEYFVGGCTALLDAVGTAITNIINIRKITPKASQPEKTIFIITTDGKENASVEYSYKKIKQMIETQKEKYKWEFIFLGANIDVAKEAEKLGVNGECSVSYHCDSKGLDLCYEGISMAISECRAKKDLSKSKWRKKINADYKGRQ